MAVAPELQQYVDGANSAAVPAFDELPISDVRVVGAAFAEAGASDPEPVEVVENRHSPGLRARSGSRLQPGAGERRWPSSLVTSTAAAS